MEQSKIQNNNIVLETESSLPDTNSVGEYLDYQRSIISKIVNILRVVNKIGITVLLLLSFLDFAIAFGWITDKCQLGPDPDHDEKEICRWQRFKHTGGKLMLMACFGVFIHPHFEFITQLFLKKHLEND